MVSLWVFFSVLSLHQMAAGWCGKARCSAGAGLRRNAIPILIAGASGVESSWSTALRAWPGARSIGEVAVRSAPGRAPRSAPRSQLVVLWPFRTVLAAS